MRAQRLLNYVTGAAVPAGCDMDMTVESITWARIELLSRPASHSGSAEAGTC